MRLTFAILAALAATPALAHEGHHDALSLVEQVRHLLTQPDHVLGAAALVVLAVAGGWSWRRERARARVRRRSSGPHHRPHQP